VFFLGHSVEPIPEGCGSKPAKVVCITMLTGDRLG